MMLRALACALLLSGCVPAGNELPGESEKTGEGRLGAASGEPEQPASGPTAPPDSGAAAPAEVRSVAPGDSAFGGAAGGHPRGARGDRAGRASPVGTWARYRAGSSGDTLPKVTEVILACPAEDPDLGGLWLELEVRGPRERVVAISMLVESLAFLAGTVDPDPDRYLLHPEGDVALEFVDTRTGRALLPGTGLAPLLPRGSGGEPWPDRMVYLGRKLERMGDGKRPVPLSREGARVLALNPDVQIGTSRAFRDDGTGRHDVPGKRGGDYRYVDFGARDYREMIDTGMNLFRISVADLPQLIDEPVFLLTFAGWRERPGLPYRGNWLGTVMYMDEPAVRCIGAEEFRDVGDPARAAAGLEADARSRLASSDRYGSRHLAAKMSEQQCDYGDLVQHNYPVWEAIASSAWYLLEAGVPGFCWQSRTDPGRFAREIEENLGVPFPSDVDRCLAFHEAILRGAARRFDVPWGVSLYGQATPAAADRLFPRAYDAGATFFWLWTSDGAHHVPRARQLEVVRELRRHERESPRPGTAREITRSARAALVLPWGYGFDDFFFGRASGYGGGQFWGSREMRLDAVNSAGVTHRAVLAAAMREALALLERAELYDVLFLRDDERAGGYDSVRRVGLDGSVTAGP